MNKLITKVQAFRQNEREIRAERRKLQRELKVIRVELRSYTEKLERFQEKLAKVVGDGAGNIPPNLNGADAKADMLVHGVLGSLWAAKSNLAELSTTWK